MRAQVDIALATFNGELYLPELLESLTRQTCSDWHLYTGDDGSTDRTVELLKEFSANHPNRITILPGVEKRLGAQANFSRTLQACRADYVLPADQDDIWHPGKVDVLLKQVLNMENRIGKEEPILIHSDLTLVDNTQKIIAPSLWHYQRTHPNYGTSFKNCMIQNTVTGCACILNRELLNKALPIPPEAIMHDWWLALTATALGELHPVCQQLVSYRQHEKNTIGAKEWALRSVWKRGLTEAKSAHQRVTAYQRQASAFLDRFRNELTPAQTKLLSKFTSLDQQMPLIRPFTALKLRLRKSDLVRTAGFYLSL